MSVGKEQNRVFFKATGRSQAIGRTNGRRFAKAIGRDLLAGVIESTKARHKIPNQQSDLIADGRPDLTNGTGWICRTNRKKRGAGRARSL
jgi:hypothetical protein